MKKVKTEPETVSITAIVTAFRRVEQTLDTLRRLSGCRPAPGEILVHVDGGEVDCANAIRVQYPDIKILLSADNIGPGGSRNKLIAAAHFEWVASFDDDSYPLDVDFFQRVWDLSQQLPTTAVLAAVVYHRGETVDPENRIGRWVADFSGGACAYRRQVFLNTAGYVPLAIAYGMEEVDLAMRLHASGERIYQAGWLRVFHDTNLNRHDDPLITSASISNLALLAFLRYPLSCWWIGVVQVAKRVIWLKNYGRYRGILRGLIEIPARLYRLRTHRELLSPSAIKSYLMLRRSCGESSLVKFERP